MLILLFSVYDEVIRQLIEPVIQAVLPIEKPSYTEPYTGTSYLLSMVTVIGGILILLLYVKFRNKRRHWPKTLSLKALFEAWIRSMLRLGRILTHYTQGQSLTMQLRMVFAVVFCIVLISLPIEQTFLNGQQSYAVRFNNWLACVFLSLSALSLVFSRNFLVNLISLSLLGFASSYFFLINGAIDVAITQLLVEVLTIIILLIALRYVTTSSSKLTPSTVIVNAFIAGFSGLCITLMLWYVKSIQFNPALQNYFAENSLDAAHGKNIVNVILVDFRSLDTFGEAMVIVTAAIGIALLLKKSLTGQRRSNVDNS